ncbi:metalloregulator ArsR/SmtB family transcription factor [Leptolyngbya sp. FACHB-261]|uniref:helix-turn-helix transcriptional regulator n=1 Tax=Leptolyngbya sp. FACHB-261 TaxID=2692806 RepID=UPI001685A444|nr:metalloregulator ArsR/SmtB family transcription factor [Leptolyngbya sp. FACHB-261]MBD2102803.1 transcriptional regulator [Leptolyngbya sp. FACHB-261]
MTAKSNLDPSLGQRAKDRILHFLKTGGAQEAVALAQQLEITPMAIRQHLQTLRSQGLVSYTEQRRPLGRPVKLWQLTPASTHRFPDNHADLTLGLLEAMRSVFGEAGLAQILAERTQQQILSYSSQITATALNERIQGLVTLRSREGYMAEVVSQSDGSWLLIENHCPICAAAQTCQGLCGSELEVFQAILGPETQIERTEHLLNNSRRCAYRIKPQPHQTPAVSNPEQTQNVKGDT